ncbi:hypothetical protein BN2475_40105 [Paraburkholderia ribeironis]|uniref:Uncharacterized protein n=1 Tax=Paraburkholderia ribeironis TaxID=1247936 RepID=A0A1N7RJS2_9BURK|nr:hypothetical protein BN2475_40105 [Paraburkholderia ribeironis]
MPNVLVAFVLATLGVIGLRALLPRKLRPSWSDLTGAILITGFLTAVGAMTALCTWFSTASVCS